MPPRNDYNMLNLNADGLTYAAWTTDQITATNTTTATNVTTNANHIVNEEYNGAWTGRTFSIPQYDWTPNTNTTQLIIDMKLDEFQRKLDRYLERIFHILKEEYNMSISEEDFMRLIKEE